MKDPIQRRTLLFGRMRRTGDLYPIDWAIVNTEVGAMLEPRPLFPLVDTGAVSPVDIQEQSFSDTMEINEDQMQDLFGTAGRQLPCNFNV